MNLFRILSLIIIIITWGMALLIYPSLPEEIPTHWNIQGEVDGTTPLFPGLIILPALMAGITLLMIILPKYDPKREHYGSVKN